MIREGSHVCNQGIHNNPVTIKGTCISIIDVSKIPAVKMRGCNIFCFFLWYMYFFIFCQMNRIMRKPVFRVSDQVRHKSCCTATEDDFRFRR